MIRSDEIPSNPAAENASSEAVLGTAARRRPGRPRGLPKPEGSGRKPGTPNKVGKEARELAGRYTTKAFKRLAVMLDSKDDKAAAIACREILDRAFGRPVSPSEISGPNGTPLHPKPLMSDTELARFMCFTLAKGAAEAGEDIPLARKPTVIENPDPFAAQREQQAARVVPQAAEQMPAPQASQAVPDGSAAMTDRERDLRELQAAPWRGGDHKPDFPTVIRFHPRPR